MKIYLVIANELDAYAYKTKSGAEKAVEDCKIGGDADARILEVELEE